MTGHTSVHLHRLASYILSRPHVPTIVYDSIYTVHSAVTTWAKKSHVFASQRQHGSIFKTTRENNVRS